jgi:hypothetical protein
MYEVFNRLNTGGINLSPQEIRTSMYHSDFYKMLYHVNGNAGWRAILRWPEPDLHMKDVEVLLRGFAMLVDGANYAPSMVRFLNQFSKRCRTHTAEQNEYLQNLFLSFVDACAHLPDDAFINKKNRRFNLALYEAVFASTCEKAFAERRTLEGLVGARGVQALETDPEFLEAALEGTTRTTNVTTRLNRARALVGPL